MRAQYHFRPSDQGLCAWDVRRLVELSRDLLSAPVSLTAIRELEEAYWSHEGKPLTCREIVEHAKLMQECDLRFPIILSQDGRVMDGMHRVCRALQEGRSEIQAVRFAVDPAPDYIGIAPEDLPYTDEGCAPQV